jgi:hypothetical protein
MNVVHYDMPTFDMGEYENKHFTCEPNTENLISNRIDVKNKACPPTQAE